LLKTLRLKLINPLSANVKYTPHDDGVTCNLRRRKIDFSERGLALKELKPIKKSE